MDKKEYRIAPIRQLQITQGQYPFKHQTSYHSQYKIVQKFPDNTPTLSSILKTHKQITHPLLTRIISQTQSDIVVTYQSVQLSLQQWIQRNIGNSVWIQLEKLVIAIRELAYCFFIKAVNVINAIHICNIGVKLYKDNDNNKYNTNNHNSSSNNTSNNKQIVMPVFKIYINISKCQLIQKMSDIAKYVIQTDKLIYSKISKQINQLANKIQKQSKTNKNYQYNNYDDNKNYVDVGNNEQTLNIGDCKMSKSYCQSVVNYQPNIINNNGNKDVKQSSNKLSHMELQQLQFSQTKTRRKRQLKQKQPNNLNNTIKIPDNSEINNSNTQTNINIVNSNKDDVNHMYASQCNFNQLNMQVRQAVDRSKKTLLDFRKYIKNT